MALESVLTHYTPSSITKRSWFHLLNISQYLEITTSPLTQVTIIFCLVKPTTSCLDPLPPTGLVLQRSQGEFPKGQIWLHHSSAFIHNLPVASNWTETSIQIPSFGLWGLRLSSQLQLLCNSYIPQMSVFLPGLCTWCPFSNPWPGHPFHTLYIYIRAYARVSFLWSLLILQF